MTHEHPGTDRHDNPTDLTEVEAVRAVVRDYIEGWHCGDAQRMDSSLHDGLVKQTVGDEAASEGLSRVTKNQMVELTREGGGRSPNAAAEILVHHVEGDIASARVATDSYLDYLHLANTGGTWRIVHDLFRHRT